MDDSNKDIGILDNDFHQSDIISNGIANNAITARNNEAPNENENYGCDYSFDFILDKVVIDKNIIKRIGIEQVAKSIAIQIDDCIILQTIHLEEFSKHTIRPLKEQLNEALESYSKDKRIDIINSIVTFLNKNIKHINYSQIRPKDKDSTTSDHDGDNEKSDLEILFELAELNTEVFFKDQYGKPYAAVRLGKEEEDKHVEIIPLKSDKYKHYLARIFRKDQDGKIVSTETVGTVINALLAEAEFDSPTVALYLRVAWGHTSNRAKTDCIYYDMTDDKRRIVEVSGHDWHIVNCSGSNMPLLFRRHNQIAQVEPDRNYDPDIFDRFLGLTNIKNKKHKQLVKTYIVSLLIPDIDHPILTTYGPKGAAKSFLLELIKKLVDPGKPVLLTLQKNIAEFIQQVNHNYLAFYDNVKFIPYWLSDEICKTVTGIGHTKRKLYSDDEDIVYEHKHCISINGINVALTEPDALDRSIFIELPDIDDEDRRKEEELLSEFEKIRPKLVAYIFDVIVKAMQIKPTLNLTRLSRMADFTEWGEAISQAMGYEEMSFIEAYNENRNEQNIVAVNENLVSSIFVKFWADYKSRNGDIPTFTGSPDLLYRELVNFAEENEIRINDQQFPKAPNILVKKLNTVKSNLKEGFGIIVKIERDKENNSIISIYENNKQQQISSNLFLNQIYALQILHKQTLR